MVSCRMVTIDVRACDVAALLDAVEEVALLEQDCENETAALKRLHRAIRKAQQEQIPTEEDA